MVNLNELRDLMVEASKNAQKLQEDCAAEGADEADLRESAFWQGKCAAFTEMALKIGRELDEHGT